MTDTTSRQLDRPQRGRDVESRMPARDGMPGGIGPVSSQATVVEQTRAAAEVAAAVQAARLCPRDEDRAYERMRKACSRWETAKRAFYSYAQGGSVVNGPTVALARDLAAMWGNVDYGTVELARDEALKRSEVRAWAWDQETNTRVSRSVIIPHVGYVGRNRRELTEMRAIDQNNNSVGGRASRETLFAILPNDLVEEAKALCQQTLDSGGGVPIPDRIDEILAIFAKARPPVTLQMLEGYVGRPRLRWEGNDVARLFTLFESLKQRTITREEAFPSEGGVSGDEIRAQAREQAPRPQQPLAPAPDPGPGDGWREPDPGQDAPVEDPPVDPGWPEVAPPGTQA